MSQVGWYDARPPGKRWKPSHMRRVSVPVSRKSADESLIPKGEAKARQRVVKEVKAIFSDVAKRGKG